MEHEIPSFLHRYFWDIDPATLDPTKHRRYIIERLLELGDSEAVSWMRMAFSQKEIVAALKEARALTKKSANFWSRVYGVPRNELACFSTQSQKDSNTIWNR